MEQLTAYPSGVDETISSYQSVDSAYPFSNVFGKDENNDTFARWYMVTGGAVKTPVYFTFDLSAIPSNATVNKVSCTAKGRMQDSSALRGGNNVISLCENDTAIVTSSNTTLFGTSASTATISTTEFTREMLENLRFKFQGTRGFFSTSTKYYMDFFGCSLVVEYTDVSGDKFLLKANGVWNECTEVYKMVNGTWVLQSDISAILDTNMKYK